MNPHRRRTDKPRCNRNRGHVHAIAVAGCIRHLEVNTFSPWWKKTSASWQILFIANSHFVVAIPEINGRNNLINSRLSKKLENLWKKSDAKNSKKGIENHEAIKKYPLACDTSDGRRRRIFTVNRCPSPSLRIGCNQRQRHHSIHSE